MQEIIAPISPELIVRVRTGAKMNQLDFWGAIGVTQSGGSRFESGRQMPKSTRALFRIFYLWGITPQALDVLRKHVEDKKKAEERIFRTIREVLTKKVKNKKK